MDFEGLWTKIWRILYPPMIYMAVTILVQIISYFVISYAKFYQLKSDGSILTIGHSVEFLESMQESVLEYSTLITLIAALITLFIIYQIVNREKIILIHYKKVTKEYLLIVVIGMAASAGFSRLLGLLPINGLIDHYENVEKTIFNGSIGVVIATIAIVVPILEEVIFRGMVYNRLKEITNPKVAMIIASVLFGVYHMNVIQGIYAFLISFLLIFVLEKFNTLLAPILLHCSANAFSIFLTYTGISDYLSKNIFVYLLLMLIELAIVGIAIQLLRKKISLVEKNKFTLRE